MVLLTILSLLLISPSFALINQIGYDDDEGKMNMIQMVKYHGYPIIQYSVHTRDGYLLTMFRIPGGYDYDLVESIEEAK